MSRKFIAGVLAASLTITTLSANTAQAGNNNDELGRFLAGATVLAITGLILSDVIEGDKKKKQKVYTHAPKPQVKQKQKYKPKHAQQYSAPRQKSLLPRSCARKVKGMENRYFLRKGCVHKKYTGSRRLPNQCVRYFRSNNGKVPGYGIRCVRNNGFGLTRF